MTSSQSFGAGFFIGKIFNLGVDIEIPIRIMGTIKRQQRNIKIKREYQNVYLR